MQKLDARAPALGVSAASIVRANYRLIAGTSGIEADPLEREDVAKERPDVVAELLQELERIEESAPAYPRATRIPAPPSDTLLEHLRGIGYVGGDWAPGGRRVPLSGRASSRASHATPHRSPA